MWTLVQHAIVRGAIAVKFFLGASLLGPQEVGRVGIALLVLAIAEGLSDTGLAPALIQGKRSPRAATLGAIWSLQFARGAVLAAILLALAAPASALFGLLDSASLFALAAVPALLRGMVNPGAVLAQRERAFAKTFVHEASAAVLDLSVTVLMLKFTSVGASSLIWGSITAEALKVISTWTWLRARICINFRWSLTKRFTAYGKWVWGTSLTTLALNQFDKVLVAKLLGAADFGLYSVATRIAQLVLAEPAFAINQYLFPTLSRLNDSGAARARQFFAAFSVKCGSVLVALCILLVLTSDLLIQHALGPSWSGSVSVLNIAAITMLQSGLISIFVALHRALGTPRVVTYAVFAQLAFLCVCAPLLIASLGVIGAAAASALAHAVTLTILVIVFLRSRRGE